MSTRCPLLSDQANICKRTESGCYTESALGTRRRELSKRDSPEDMRSNTQCSVVAREVPALTQPGPTVPTSAGYQRAMGRPYVGQMKLAVHPAPLNTHRTSTTSPAEHGVDQVGEVRAAVNLHNDLTAHMPAVKDITQLHVFNHVHGTKS